MTTVTTYHKSTCYRFVSIHDFTIDIWPNGAKILHVAHQGMDLMLWAQVDIEEELRKHRFSVLGTGHTIPDNISVLRYIGTAHNQQLGLVWHVFDQGEIE